MTVIVAVVGALVVAAGQPTGCELATVRRDAANDASCLACHDGSAGPSIGLGDARHMVGRRYASAWLDSRSLKALRYGGPVVLHDGYVTCLSCHDPQSRLRNHVAAFDLCVECHAK